MLQVQQNSMQVTNMYRMQDVVINYMLVRFRHVMGTLDLTNMQEAKNFL